jgi:hypothetical protein
VSNAAEKVRRSIQAKLTVHPPAEELKVALTGMERISWWAEELVLGYMASAAGRKSYHIGLTDKRILLFPLSDWSGKPSGESSEIHLARIKDIEYKKGLLFSRLEILFMSDVKRTFMLALPFRKSGEQFADAFSLLQIPPISDAEMEFAVQQEAKYEETKGEMVTNAVVAFFLVLFVLIILNLLL